MRGDPQDFEILSDGTPSWECEPVDDSTERATEGGVVCLSEFVTGQDLVYKEDDTFAANKDSPEDIVTSLEVYLDLSIAQSKHLQIIFCMGLRDRLCNDNLQHLQGH